MAENEKADVTQDDRILRITTPFDEDEPNYLLLQGVDLDEEISRLPVAECVVLHNETKEGDVPTLLDVPRILGQPVNIFFATPDGAERVFHGIVNRCTQADRDKRFTYYKLSVVPTHWLLTQTQKSRIFQHIAIPQLLEEVLGDYPHEIQLGSVDWKPRNYVVQYRESDFDFISRLMEEEGIFYYFRHEEDSHKLIICVSPQSHEKVTSKYEIPYLTRIEEQDPGTTYIQNFIVDYRLQTGKVTMWDYTHQKPTDHFESIETTRFQFINNQENLEHYLYPSGSIRKYDSVDAGGGDRSSELQNMSDDIKRSVKVMQEMIDVRHRTITVKGNCPALVAGMRFKMTGNPTSEYNAEYVVTSIRHTAVQSPHYFSDMPDGGYSNSFECITWGQGATTFRPQPITPKPMILASQTATVVGPSGQEIFTDKYGRVKVQFKWDREGQFNEASSCWTRVAQHWAGNRWGSMFIPRIGMEVVVHFLEGNPDQPIITGCVYNNDAMPPYELPENKNLSGIKSDSTLGGEGFNEWRFDDTKGEEQIFMHGQKNLDVRIKNDRFELIGNDRHLIVKRDKNETIERDEHRLVERDVFTKIKRDNHLKIEGKEAKEVTGSLSLKVDGDVAEKFSGNHSEITAGSVYIKSGQTLIIEAGAQISLKAAGSFIDIGPSGVTISGTMVLINSGGAAGGGTESSIVAPKPPEKTLEAAKADPGKRMENYKNQLRQMPKQKIPTHTQPSHKPDSPANEKKKSWIEVVLKDEDGVPVPGERYRVTLPDGTTLAEGTLDGDGYAKVSNIDPGNCKVTFPDMDGRSWKKA